jgi:hypothetical protein
MIYNKDELINEKYEYNEKISKLANVGKSLMGDTQFVPINEPKRKKHSDHNHIMLNETYHSFQNKDEYGNNTANFFNNTGMNDLHMGTQYSSRKAKNPANFGDVMTTFDLNNQIDELVKISYKNDPKAKIEALNKKIQFDLGNIEKDNHTIEYHDPKKFSKKVDFSKLDNILNSIIDEENKSKDTKNKGSGKEEDKIGIKENPKVKELNKETKNKEAASGKEEEIERDKEINSNSVNKKEEENNLQESGENNQGKNEKLKEKTKGNTKDEKKILEGSQKNSLQKDENVQKIKENQKEEETNKENTINKAKTDTQNKSKEPVNDDKTNQPSKEDQSSSNEANNLNNNPKQEINNKEDKKPNGPNNNNLKKQEESVKENKEKKKEKTEEVKSSKDKNNGGEKKK